MKSWLLTLLFIAFALFLALLLSGCAGRVNAVELGAGYDHHIDEGRNPQSVIRYRNEPKDGDSGWVYEFDHHSSFQNGWPFNEKPEDLVNQHSLIYRWTW